MGKRGRGNGEYFASAQEGTRTVSEVKVILVGEGASGKTSLTRCLREERFNAHEETTHGIRIKPWQLVTDDQPLRCNLWDFGGQEIMHATHQFFLSRRSLYIQAGRSPLYHCADEEVRALLRAGRR